MLRTSIHFLAFQILLLSLRYEFTASKRTITICPGFNFFANPNESYASGGVGCFVNEKYLVSEAKSVDFISADILKVFIEIGHIDYVFLCCYRLHMFNVVTVIEEFSCFLAN